MDYPGKILDEFNVSTGNLTKEQLKDVDRDLRNFTRILFVLFLIAGFLGVWFLYWYIYPVLFPNYFDNSQEEPNSILLMLMFFLPFFISYKIYKFLGYYYINNRVKELQLNNLEVKMEKIEATINKSEPLSPQVQSEVDRIRAFGEKK